VIVRVCLILCLAVAACKSDVQSGIEAANQLFFEQKYARAEALYRRTLKRIDERDGGKAKPSPELLAVLDRLGRINALYLHNYEQAVSDYGRLVADYPDSEEGFEAQVTVADIFENRLGNQAQAATELQRLVRKFPNHKDTPKYQLQLAELYFRMKNHEQAELASQELVSRWPNSPYVPKARFNVANVAYVMGRGQEALTAYEKLLKDFPDDPVAPLVQFEMASCYQELGEEGKALDILFEALKTHPHPQVVQRKISRIRRRQSITAPKNNNIIAEHGAAASRPSGKRKADQTAVKAPEKEAPAPKEAPEDAQ
jgi:TolA-binding protein